MFFPDEVSAEKRESLFTIGELAAIYHVPKPTLIHYYRSGLLVPVYKNPANGYNYYSVRQFLTLDIILGLRMLDVPIKKIKEFLAAKSPAALASIYSQKEQGCLKRVAEIKRLASRLQRLLNSFDRTSHQPTGLVEITYQSARPYKISQPIRPEMTHNERAAAFIEHNHAILEWTAFNCYPTGWIVKGEDFFSGNPNTTRHYFTLFAEDDAPPDAAYLPEGLYLSFHFHGTYYRNAKPAQEKISDFLQRNAMKVLGDVYNLPVRNHWQTDDTATYINCLFMRVEYRE